MTKKTDIIDRYSFIRHRMQKFFFIIIFLEVFLTSFHQPEPRKIIIQPDTTKISSRKIITELSTPLDTNKINVINATFLGNDKRNFYGIKPPSKLKEIWRFNLGTGITKVNGKSFAWSGAGWTGQPLLVLEDSIPYLIQGAYDHNLRKINALTGAEVWRYPFDDVIKGTGTIWINTKAKTIDEKYVILQGSRQGVSTSFTDAFIPSFRAISYITGKEFWRMNSRQTDCYSRDVDGSAMIINDTAYVGLENGVFTVFNPDKNSAITKNNIVQPKIFEEHMLYEKSDMLKHGADLVSESSPSLLGNKIYETSGSGHIYGYNLKSRKIDWDFFTGSDLNGSSAVTKDSCLLVTIEKQFIQGRGGVIKLNPSKSLEQSVVWFFPTEDKRFAEWLGGIIGSLSINDYYNKNESMPAMAAFIGIDGFLYVVDYKSIEPNKKVLGFDNKTLYNTPKLLFKFDVGASIATPVIYENRLIATTYRGVYLFEFDTKMHFKLLDSKMIGSVESTPIAYNHRIFVACRDGNLYCYGDDSVKAKKKELFAVNDRKYTHKENLIAKKEIKIEKNETAAIKKEAPIKIISERKSEHKTLVESSSEKGMYYLITGSFSIKNNADKLSTQMSSKGFKTKILINAKGLYLVSIFATSVKEDVNTECSKQKTKGIDSWVYSKN